MAKPRRRTLSRATAPAVPVPEPVKPVAVVDIGASAVRLLVAEAQPGQPPVILEEASKGVLLGYDTFKNNRLGTKTIEAALRALEGFRRIIDTYVDEGDLDARRALTAISRVRHISVTHPQ